MHKDRLEILNSVASWYERNGFQVRVNDGRLRSFPLVHRGRRMEPPLIVWERDRIVRFVDVESPWSLDGGAPLRWENLVSSDVPLHVYVPEDRLDFAWSLRTAHSTTWPSLLTYDTSILTRDAGGQGAHGCA